MSVRIAIVVPGRFDAFDLARELIKQGNEVILLTNYPKFKVAEFGISSIHVRSFLIQGILSRVVHRINQALGTNALESFINHLFSRWAFSQLKKENLDAVYCFSGIAEELFIALATTSVFKFLVRGSTHIRYQHQLLSSEEERSHTPVDKPSIWMIQREEREYQLADKIVVLSNFAQQSFIEQGISADRLAVLRLGAQLDIFRPSEGVAIARSNRIRQNRPLRVLMVGTFSLRKGAIDLVEIASALQSEFSFRFVGAVSTDAQFLLGKAQSCIKFMGKHPQHHLPEFYKWADLFIFTTIEDGYAAVLSQAQASGLLILATSNCAAPDIVVEGQGGWVFPIRSPQAFKERLLWCNDNRETLADMSRQIFHRFQSRDWSDMAKELADRIANQKKSS